MSKPLVIAVVGPTCTGKTDLAIKLALRLNGEIVACDSRTVYRHMDVGTAKPTVAERQGVPHHLFDLVDPDQRFTVAQYKDCAEEALDQIFLREKVPIVCGGTGFYARALLEGLVIPAVEPQEDLRSELNEIADRHGNLALFQKLQDVDAVTASRLNPNDRFRVVRALEVSITKGVPFSQLINRSELPFDVVWIGLTVGDRSYLRALIAQRFQLQLESGLLAEVESLYKRYGATRAITNSVNYQEFLPYIDGEILLQEAIDQCIKHNNQLARRQLIWFRANSSITWFAIDRMQRDQLIEDALSIVAAKVN